MTATIRVSILKSIALLVCLAAIISLIKPTFAKDATPAANTRKATIQQKIDTRKENIASKIATLKDKIASKEAALKARLAAFRDQRKAQIADRINTTLNRINQNQTAQMKKHLELMSTILDKLEARVNSSKPDIKNSVAAKEAIAASRAKIASATAAVLAQSQKDDTLTVSSESKIRTDAQSITSQLKTDLQAIRKQVIEAKQSVANVIRVAKSGQKIATPSAKEATSGGQQ